MSDTDTDSDTDPDPELTVTGPAPYDVKPVTCDYSKKEAPGWGCLLDPDVVQKKRGQPGLSRLAEFFYRLQPSR